MRDAASTATEHASYGYTTVGDAGLRVLQAIARTTYRSAYIASYGVVYTTVFVAQSVLLLDNPVTRGLYDGGAAERKALRVARADHNRVRRTAHK
jgi:hypothetical protein